jgi:hypothetical protein
MTESESLSLGEKECMTREGRKNSNSAIFFGKKIAESDCFVPLTGFEPMYWARKAHVLGLFCWGYRKNRTDFKLECKLWSLVENIVAISVGITYFDEVSF